MDVTALVITAAVALPAAAFAYWALRRRRRRLMGSNPEWARVWDDLPLRTRFRIARGVRRGERFSDPADARLAVGYAGYLDQELSWRRGPYLPCHGRDGLRRNRRARAR